MSETLQDIAERAQEKINATKERNDTPIGESIHDLESFEENTTESAVNTTDSVEDEDDDTVVAMGYTVERRKRPDEEIIEKKEAGPDITDDDLFGDNELETEEEFELSDEILREKLSDLDDDAFNEASSTIKKDIDEYRKSLIMNNGFTVQEANMAAKNRMNKLVDEASKKYEEENPSAVVIEVEKNDEGKLVIPEEAKDKVVKTKVLQLKIVEDATLAELPIENVKKSQKVALLNSVDTCLSQYSVPLPLINDYVQFKGSQIIQLIQAVRYEDTTPAELITKKASLIYNQLVNGANLKKYDDNGKTIMSYTDFTNKFFFHDIDLALYAILVASSMEEIESELTCGDCQEVFPWKYNIKSLLNLDHLSDDFKARFDDILGHKTDVEYLQNLYRENNTGWRVKSPITNNVYDLNYPTVARAINVQKHVDPEDETSVYLSAFTMFIGDMYVYNKATGRYIPLDSATEYRQIFDHVSRVPQEEIDLIMKFLQPKLYAPRFILESKCDKCGNEMRNVLQIEEMVFLKARGSSTEIH